MNLLLLSEDASSIERIGNAVLGLFKNNEVTMHTVSDAAEAIELLTKGIHELVIVDIELPGAIEAMEEIHPLLCGSMLYTLLDGFGSLKRMQSVLRVSLDGYFLKSAEISFIQETLKNIYVQLNPFPENKTDEDNLNRKIEEEKPYIFEDLVRELFSSSFEDISSINGTYTLLNEYLEPQDHFCVIAIRPLRLPDQTENGLAEMIRLRDEARNWLPSVNRVCLMYSKYVILLLSLSPWKSIPNSQILLEYGLRSHILTYEQKWGKCISVGTSMECTGLPYLHIAYQQAKAAAKWGISHSEMLPLTLYNDYASNSGTSFMLDSRMIEELLDAQADNDIHRIRNIMQTYLTNITLGAPKDKESIHRLWMDATAVIMIAASSLSLPLDTQSLTGLLNYTDFADTTELADWFVDKIETITEIRKDKAMRKEQMLVEHAKSIIKKEPGYHFTTQEMAVRLGISVSYFGTIFKRCEGISFLDYMTNQTLLRAVALLSNPRIRLNEACLMVGFKDANYFSRIFKKHYGCTPSQFRNRLK